MVVPHDDAFLRPCIVIDLDHAELQKHIDDHLIGEIKGDVRQHLLRPEPKEVVFVANEPWEGNTSGYYTYFQDGDTYRMIYRGWQHDEQMNPTRHSHGSWRRMRRPRQAFSAGRSSGSDLRALRTAHPSRPGNGQERATTA